MPVVLSGTTQPTPRTIALLGQGSWGTAIAIHLANNGHTVRLWGRNPAQAEQLATHRVNTRYLPDIVLPKGIQPLAGDLKTLLTQTEDIFVSVPSHAFSDTLHALQPFWTPRHRLMWLTKGLDKTTGQFLHDIVGNILGPTVATAILSGPSFAREVAKGLPTAVVIASHDAAWAKHLVELFLSSTFRVYYSQDMLGVQLGGVIKNVMAVAAGISDGLNFGANARAALITRGIAEMVRLGEKLGATRETLFGLAGCGDMILSCTDNQSRNRRFGLALANGKTSQQALDEIGQAVEAIYNIDQVHQLAIKNTLEMPITREVFRIFHSQTTPQQAVDTLFSRTPTEEYILANDSKIV